MSLELTSHLTSRVSELDDRNSFVNSILLRHMALRNSMNTSYSLAPRHLRMLLRAPCLPLVSNMVLCGSKSGDRICLCALTMAFLLLILGQLVRAPVRRYFWLYTNSIRLCHTPQFPSPEPTEASKCSDITSTRSINWTPCMFKL